MCPSRSLHERRASSQGRLSPPIGLLALAPLLSLAAAAASCGGERALSARDAGEDTAGRGGSSPSGAGGTGAAAGGAGGTGAAGAGGRGGGVGTGGGGGGSVVTGAGGSGSGSGSSDGGIDRADSGPDLPVDRPPPTRANGSPCNSGTECTSTFCVDKFCCENSCTGTCTTCADVPGSCKFAAAATDLRNECP